MAESASSSSIVQAATVEVNEKIDDEYRGQAEYDQLGSGKASEALERQAKENEHRRNEQFRDHFERLAILCLYLGALLIAVVGLTWVWHILLPQGLHWLNADQVGKVQSLLLGGILTSVVTGHIKKRLT